MCAMNDLRWQMMDRPSVKTGRCAVCGHGAVHGHHVVQKGHGGVPAEFNRRIPIIHLCPICHSLVHGKRLFIFWDDDNGGWVYMRSVRRMDDHEAWEMRGEFEQLPGWRQAQEDAVHKVFGRKS